MAVYTYDNILKVTLLKKLEVYLNRNVQRILGIEETITKEQF